MIPKSGYRLSEKPGLGLDLGDHAQTKNQSLPQKGKCKMTDILATIESIWQKDEQWVITTLVRIRQGAQIFESDLKQALTWITAHAQEITSDIQSVVGIIQTSGLVITPTIQKAITDANAAVTAVNAIAASVNSGHNVAQTLVAGYQATKQAQISTATAQSAVTATVQPATAQPAVAA
jgi:hypothetical protein